MGIRPEDIVIDRKAAEDADAMGKVYVTSPVGKDMVIEVDVEGHHIKVITPSTYNVDMGQEVWLRCNNEKIHIFNNNDSMAYF